MRKKQERSTKRSIIGSRKGSIPFRIVGIGASAGGLDAVTQLLENLPSNTGMVYVYIQHLDPTHKSMLSSILSKATKMKVQEAKNLLPIRPNYFYIIPPNKELTIIDGILKLRPRPARPKLFLPINEFFSSLAIKEKERAIGIVLSGDASDGTEGLKAIKMKGGITFAQDASAKFQSMPKSAIANGVVDMVLSPAGIAHELEKLSKNKNAMLAPIKEEPNEGPVEEGGDEDLSNILQLLKVSTGIDFHHYKKSTLRRRVTRRMVLFKLPTLKAYIRYLRQHHSEINALYHDLLINVTSFFRDSDSIEFLKKNIFKRILKNKGANIPIRIWVPACSTGEEAYSIAILLVELLGENTSTNIQIFATDLSELAINKARTGVYTREDLQNVSTKRLQRFFKKTDDNYRIIKSIRDLCVFAPHNIFKDPPFSRLDLISCCNLFIYLDTILQQKIMNTFHYSLNTDGFLVLGKSETIGGSLQLFSQIDKRFRIYAKKKDSSGRPMTEINYKVPEVSPLAMMSLKKATQKTITTSFDLEKGIDSILLSHFVPPSVVVNRNLDIIQFRGAVGSFLEPSPGKASLNLLKMAKAGLAIELRNAVHKSIRSETPVKKSGIEINRNGNTQHLNFEVYPFSGEANEILCIISFSKTAGPPLHETSATANNKRIKQLEQELVAAREDMRSVVEEQEAVNEELQSANEEIVSSNEELQSINEELETSKEEVESSNQELTTINLELQMRNLQLTESYEYAEAVFDTIGEAVIALDEDLRIRSCNKSFYRIFKVKEEDTEGKLIYELGDREWDIPQLRKLLEELNAKKKEFSGFPVHHIFPGIGEKYMLLNARKVTQKTPKLEIILLAIEDVTEQSITRKLTEEREEWFRNMADNSPALIWFADVNGMRTFFNKTWLEYTGTNEESQMGRGWEKIIHPDDLASFVDIYNTAFATKTRFHKEYRLRRYDGEYRWIMSRGNPVFSIEGAFRGFQGVCNEIHDQRLINEELERRVVQRTKALQQANKNLEQSNNELMQFAYVASHDLQEPLRKIITYADLLKEEIGNKDEEKSLDILKRIDSSSKRMRMLIDDLLNFSRTVKIEKDFVKLNLRESLKNALTDLDLLISEKKAHIVIKELPVIYAIPLQMKQLFYNLVNNALKFSKENVPPVIDIYSRSISPADMENFPTLDKSLSYYEIIVKDNGLGFEKEFAEQIFVIFQRLGTRNTPGTGIGLALCQKIVSNHGGEIFAESEPDKGSEFHIILPSKIKV